VTAAEPSLFDQVGAARLRAMVADFYERVFADVMIGSLQQGEHVHGASWLVLTAWAVVMPLLAAWRFSWD